MWWLSNFGSPNEDVLTNETSDMECAHKIKGNRSKLFSDFYVIFEAEVANIVLVVACLDQHQADKLGVSMLILSSNTSLAFSNNYDKRASFNQNFLSL